MMNTYKERQKFKQWWLWLILVGALLVPVILVAYDILVQHKAYNTTDIVGGASVPVAILILFYFVRLDTEISAEGVSYKFFPVHIRLKTIPWSEISKAYIRQYKPLAEYGGWGLRYGLKGTGRAINISGNIGLQLELKNGKKILLGTGKGEEVKTYIIDLVRNKVIGKDVIN